MPSRSTLATGVVLIVGLLAILTFASFPIKLFYEYNEPLMTPEQVLALDPSPAVVIYQ